MKTFIFTGAIIIGFFCFTQCQSKREAPVKVETPKIISDETPGKMFVGIASHGAFFYHLGDTGRCEKIELSDLDSLLIDHKEKYPVAVFVIAGCEGGSVTELEKIINRFKALGIGRFTLSKSGPCCQPW